MSRFESSKIGKALAEKPYKQSIIEGSVVTVGAYLKIGQIIPRVL